MTTFTFSLGAIETRRIAALCSSDQTNRPLNPHLFMGDGYGGTPIVPAYGVGAWSTQDVAQSIVNLSALPAGRRAISTGLHNFIWKNADDRVRNAGGVIVGSPTPVAGNVYYFDNSASGVGGAAVGYSNLFLDNFMVQAYAWGRAEGLALQAGGVTVDFLIFDNEALIDEFKVGTSYMAALKADPRWLTDNWNGNGQLSSQSRLAQIISEATSGATTAFDSVQYLSANTTHINAWKAYVYERRKAGLGQAIAGFKSVFPQCSGSNYEDHGRSGVIVNAGGQARGLTDLNGHLYYQTGVVGDFASEISYNWAGQQEDNQLQSVNTGSVWINSANPYHGLIWEVSRAMGSIQSGRYVMPWIAYMGFDDSDFALGGYGEAGGADKCPYWEANVAFQGLMASVPQYLSGRWFTGGLLYWNSRAYVLSGGEQTLSNGGVDQANHLIWDNGNRTGRNRPGLMQSFKVYGSTNINGTYTINYANGGVWYDAGADRTYYRVNEAIPGATADGKISMACTDTQDALVEAVLVEIDAIVGTKGPRAAAQRSIYVGEADGTDTEKVPNGSVLTWVGVRNGPNITYAIAIGRSSIIKSAWASHSITGYVNGVSIGTVATIGATKSYAYYTRAYSASEIVTFRWTHPAITNLLTSTDFLHASWVQDNPGNIAQTASFLSPIDGTQAYDFENTDAIASFAVSEGNIYTVSCYFHASKLVNLRVLAGSDGSTIINLNDQVTKNRWLRYHLTFVAPHGETTCKMMVSLPSATSYDCIVCHPQVVKGILPGPVA